MTKIAFITVVIGAIVVVGVGTFVVAKIFLDSTGQPSTNIPSSAPANSAAQPTTVPSSNTVPLATWDGGIVQAKDIKIDPKTVPDSYNAGHYFVGYQPPGSASDPNAVTKPPYTIEYIDGTQYFSIALLQKPIGAARQEAEQYLMTHLGLKPGDMCRIKYMVSTPNSVDQTYAGTSLGFSFCNGAIKLP
ncbi:MAG: hypothetical protein Q7R71_00340 [bacterium]|nr:hypothetical protein [bacterium]